MNQNWYSNVVQYVVFHMNNIVYANEVNSWYPEQGSKEMVWRYFQPLFTFKLLLPQSTDIYLEVDFLG